LRTVTVENRHALIAPILSHLYTSNTAGGEGKPDRPLKTVTAGGGHHAVAAPVLTYAQQGGANRSITDPHHTICANSKDQNAVIVPSLISIAHGDSGGRREYPLTETMGVVTSGGIAHALVAPTLLQTGYGEAPGQAPRSLDLGAPLGTVVAGGIKHATAAVYLAQQNGGPRMDAHCGHDVAEPISTIAGSGSHQTPIAAFIARQFGASTGHAADVPLGTTTAGGQGKSQLVAPWFAKYYGAGTGSATDEPCHTVTVNDRFGHVEAELKAPPFTEEHVERAREVADFMRAHDAWDDREFVTIEIDGAAFVIVDIGMRMLTPRELFNAQGFPKDYVIEGVWQQFDDEWAWVPFSKSVQVSCCGNSVCPDLAEAVVRSNCGHLAAAADQHNHEREAKA
jgi:DNA (cytosine-5)-methyltransferase 1